MGVWVWSQREGVLGIQNVDGNNKYQFLNAGCKIAHAITLLTQHARINVTKVVTAVGSCLLEENEPRLNGFFLEG